MGRIAPSTRIEEETDVHTIIGAVQFDECHDVWQAFLERRSSFPRSSVIVRIGQDVANVALATVESEMVGNTPFDLGERA